MIKNHSRRDISAVVLLSLAACSAPNSQSNGLDADAVRQNYAKSLRPDPDSVKDNELDRSRVAESPSAQREYFRQLQLAARETVRLRLEIRKDMGSLSLADLAPDERQKIVTNREDFIRNLHQGMRYLAAKLGQEGLSASQWLDQHEWWREHATRADRMAVGG